MHCTPRGRVSALPCPAYPDPASLPRRPTRWGAGPPPFAGQQQQQQQQQGGAVASQGSTNGNSGPASSQFRSQSPLNPAAAGSASPSAAASTQKAQTQTGMPNSSSESAAAAGGVSAFPAVQAGPADAAKMHDKMLVSGARKAEGRAMPNVVVDARSVLGTCRSHSCLHLPQSPRNSSSLPISS